MRALIAILAVAVLLNACAPRIHTNVTRFDQLPGSTADKRVLFVPLEEQQTSAAYQTYADRVAVKLAQFGMARTTDLADADYAVLMVYGVGGERQITGAVPLYGQTGGGTTYQSGSMSAYGTGGTATGIYSGTTHTAPTYGVVGMMPYSRTEYDRHFTMRIIDIERSTPEQIVPVYEGTVVSAGAASSFDQVAGCMLQALFQDFRRSGTESITLDASTCP